MSQFTPRFLFRASALDGRGDPWIADGVHLRVSVSAQLGTPIHPFVAWRLTNVDYLEPLPLDVRWTTRQGKLLPSGSFDVSATGPVSGAITGTNGQWRSPGWCFLRLEGDDVGLQVRLLEGQVTPFGRPVTAVRSMPPYAFGGTQLSALRVSGNGTMNRLVGLHEEQFLSDMLGEPLIFGLPIKDAPWYISSREPFSEAEKRLERGQSKRFGPPDCPDGPFQAMSAGDEAQNILDHLGPAHIDLWLDEAFNSGDLPATVVREFKGQKEKQPMVASLPAWNTLLMMAADPRIARYLGFATVFDPPLLDTGKPAAWMVAAQFAMPQEQVDAFRQQSGINLQTDSSNSSWFLNFVQGRLQELFPDSREMRSKLKTMRWAVVTVATLAVAAIDAPPDVPRAPMPRLAGPGQWNGSDGGAHWTQAVCLQGQPPSGMVSFARIAPGPVTSLHRRFPETGEAARATALLANWSYQPPKTLNGFDFEALRGAGGKLWMPPVLTDGQVPADAAGAAWRLWQADEFGRWSEPAQLSAPLPERPLAPAPAPELHFHPVEVNGDQPASPGTLSVRIDVPPPQSLAPGAFPIQAAEYAVDGAPPQSILLASGQSVVIVDVEAPALSPGASTIVTITARFRDIAGRTSPDGQASRRVFDPRPVMPNPTAPTILWAGRLDATGKAELALMWNAASPLARYRVYLGDERRLADALRLTVTDSGTRAARAKAIYDRAKAGALADKGLFTLLTEQPLLPDADGAVRFQYQLPGGLSGVQFLRIVPVTGIGVEAPFATCGLVPVAIPFSESPTAPSIRVTPVAGGVQVDVLAYGLALETLARYGYPASGRGPEYRVRRTRGRLSEAIYLPVVQQGTLTPPDPAGPGDAPWTASFIELEDSLPSYITHTWLAEVRYPPEPSQAEALAEPSPLVVRQQWGSASGTAESLWSVSSLPAATTLVATAPPAALVDVVAQKQPDGRVRLSIPAVPSTHPKAIGLYQLIIWKWVKADGVDQLADSEPVRRPLDGEAQGFEFFDDNVTGDAAAYSVALIDPLGRTGALTRVDVSNERHNSAR